MSEYLNAADINGIIQLNLLIRSYNIAGKVIKGLSQSLTENEFSLGLPFGDEGDLVPVRAKAERAERRTRGLQGRGAQSPPLPIPK
ncbi:MAG: hypothetical protein ACKO45_05145 [Cyanobium sp.]